MELYLAAPILPQVAAGASHLPGKEGMCAYKVGASRISPRLARTSKIERLPCKHKFLMVTVGVMVEAAFTRPFMS